MGVFGLISGGVGVKDPALSIIVPCYNEEDTLPSTKMTLQAILDKLIQKEKISRQSHILFVDDGSRDKTWQVINSFLSEKYVRGLKLVKNIGQQKAIIAGIEEAVARSDIFVTIDADLQDDVKAIEKMIDFSSNGVRIIYGVRANRDSDTWFKRSTANLFYKILSKAKDSVVIDHGEFRLIDRKVAIEIVQNKSRIKFLRYFISSLPYKSDRVYYKRSKRKQGKSKYNIYKMIRLAIDGLSQ